MTRQLVFTVAMAAAIIPAAAAGDKAKPAKVAPRAHSATECSGGDHIDLTVSGRIGVSLSQLPPSKTRGIFTGPGGEHVEVVWDRHESSRLEHLVRLPSTQGSWRFSLSAEPIRFVTEPGQNYAMCTRFGSGSCKAGATGCKLGDGTTIFFRQVQGDVTLTDAFLPGGTTLAADAAGWSLGGLGDAANDLVATLGEIVVERATSEATRLLRERLVDLVCAQKLKGKLDLSRTCALLHHIRIEELSGIGNTLLSALQQDLLAWALDQTWVEELSPELQLTLKVAGFAAITAASPLQHLSGGEANSVLDSLRRHYQSNDKLKALITVVADCRLRQQCTSSEIYELLVNVGKLNQRKIAAREPVSNDHGTAQEDYLAQAIVWIDQVRGVLNPPATMSARERLSAAIMLTTQALSISGVTEKHPERFQSLARLAAGVAESDIQKVLAEVPVLIGVEDEATKSDLRRATRILGGLGAYLSSYLTNDKASPEEEQARREARKETLERLIDSATDRSERPGDWIVSLGGALRLVGGGRHDLTENVWLPDTPLSLPMGLAVDMVPARFGGAHLQLGVIDLGNYLQWQETGQGDSLQLQEPEGLELFDFSVTAAWVIKGASPSFPFYVGATVGYAPFLEGTTLAGDSAVGSLRIAAVLGVYVPFWDMN